MVASVGVVAVSEMTTRVSATQAGLGAPVAEITYFTVRTAPAGLSVSSVNVAVAVSLLPTGTGDGKRSLLAP